MTEAFFAYEYKNCCRKELSVILKDTENKRKASLIAVLCIFAAVLGCCFLFPKLSVLFIILFIIASCQIILKYKRESKKVILGKILSFIGDFADSKKRTDIKDNFLFNDFDGIKVYNSLTGKYGLINLDVDEIKLSLNKKTVFRGVVLKFPCIKKFRGITVIKPITEKYTKCITKTESKNPEFNALFDIYTTDKTESRYLITDSFINNLILLHKKAGFANNVSVSFENENVYIAQPTKRNWLKVPLIKNAADVRNYKGILFQIMLLLKIIDPLSQKGNF